ncbi:serine/arginine repetitive matrix protein 1-like [Rhodamnia argentea]|uniref:Serine/arginine repetitive matrix protein 1-like n=1 Tax=Rhodamnia argentea TaxID=178133 RepID=A0A8B8P1A1_9MYRT|nr:serine/arginine repetitive matrix protein 1-like [Rhodamnia argentea]XP_030528605.1 serine/arginine repetitive matrix protein 1-like [Rhodamnia argentea]XP_048129569.1 serine/arginine repetitive matrix protein 1-like [Rhodamnia argentea]
MEDLTTGDPLVPPNFVTIHHLREQWLKRQQPQQKLKELETRPRSPPGKPPPGRTRTPPPPPSFPPPAQKDKGKRPEQELPRRETEVERERVKASSPRDESDSRPSPADRLAVRRNASVKEGSDGRQAIDSDGPKPSEKSSRGEYAGFGGAEKAESALLKGQLKQPEQGLPQGETFTERQRVKATPRNESYSRPSPANRRGVRRNTSVKEGSDGRQAIDSNGPKPSEGSSRGEYAGSGADEEAESAPVKDQRKQPEKELVRGETNTKRERVKASPRNESNSRPSPANCWAVRCNTSVKEGIDGRQAIDSNCPKPSKKSSRGEYKSFGADEKAESALVAAVSVVAESANQVKKTEESEKKKKKDRRYKNNNKWKGKGRLDEDIVRAKEKGLKLEEGEANEPAAKVKKEKFQRASSEGQTVTPESKEVRVEAKTKEGVVHTSAKEVKKLFGRAGSERKNAMLESKEGRVEVENVAANASHVRAEAEGLNKQVLAINSKVEIEGGLRNLSLQYDSKKGGFQRRRSYRGDRTVYGVIEGKEEQRRVRKQSSDAVWVRKEDTTDGNAGESRVTLVL